MRPLARRMAGSAPAMSTCAMIQPPKTSPWTFASAGIGTTRNSGMRPCGSVVDAGSMGVSRTGRRWPQNSGLPAKRTMRRTTVLDPPPAPGAPAVRGDWHTIARLLPYLWAYRWRVGLALACLIAAKFANVGVPLVLKQIVDALDLKAGDARSVLVVPVALLVAYGLLRVGVTLFTELREVIFARVTHDASRTITLQVFRHLFSLSLRFHLERQMGGMSRDIERGSQGISSLISYTLYSILPTLVEITLVIGYLMLNYDASFATIALVALVLYVAYTVRVTEWRTKFRRQMNEQDSRASTRAIDA